ncbi:MAG TPA: YlaF family protein [Neobacillus sp.]
MKQIKWIFLFYSVLAAISIMGVGIAISEKSMIGAIGCIVAVIIIMGIGFKRKAKMRENGLL